MSKIQRREDVSSSSKCDARQQISRQNQHAHVSEGGERLKKESVLEDFTEIRTDKKGRRYSVAL